MKKYSAYKPESINAWFIEGPSMNGFVTCDDERDALLIIAALNNAAAMKIPGLARKAYATEAALGSLRQSLEGATCG